MTTIHTDAAEASNTPTNQRGFEGFLGSTDAFEANEKARPKALNAKEKKVHATKAKVQRIRGEKTIADADLDRERVHHAKAEARLRDDPDTAARGRGFISGWAARLFAAVLVVGLYFVDSTLLLVLLLSKTNTRLLTLVVVAASAVTAWMYGTLSRTWADEPHRHVTLGPRHVRKMRIALVLGIGIEVLLAVIRAVGSGTPLSSLLLGLAGCGLWAAVAYMAYSAHDGAAAVAGRHWRKVKRSAHRTNRDAAYADKLLGKLRLAQQDLVQAAANELLTVNELIDSSMSVWAQSHALPDRPTWSWLDRLELLADGTLPACCTLDGEQADTPRPALELEA